MRIQTLKHNFSLLKALQRFLIFILIQQNQSLQLLQIRLIQLISFHLRRTLIDQMQRIIILPKQIQIRRIIYYHLLSRMQLLTPLHQLRRFLKIHTQSLLKQNSAPS